MNLIHLAVLVVLPINSRQLINNKNGVNWPEGSWTLPSSLPQMEANLIGPACKRHFDHYISELQNMKLWALQMYDATGKIGSGLLRGNSAQLGDYDECLSISEPEKDINGQYCLTSLFIEPRNSSAEAINSVLNLVTSHKLFHGTLDDNNIKITPSYNELLWGLCVPSSCSANEVKNILSHTLQRYNSTERGLDIKLDLKPKSCTIRDDNKSFTVPFLVTLAIFVLLMATTVCATILDSYKIRQGFSISEFQTSESLWEQILKSFSLHRTIPDLLDTTIGDDITCIHGIRFIFSIAIFLVHKVMFNMFIPAYNRTLLAESLESTWTMLFRAFWSGVDTFVLISGLLTSYFSTKKLKAGQTLDIPSMYIQRYIKFTPLFYMTIMTLNILNHISDGPMKIHVGSHFVEKCQSTWKSLLYISNIDSMNEMCFPPSHQLVTDMQMYILAPFIILAMWRWRKQTLITIGLSIICLTLYKGVFIYKENYLSVIHYGASNRKIVESGDQFYSNTIHRLTPYFSGLVLGYILQMKMKEELRLSTEHLNIGSGLAVVCAYYSFFALSAASKRGYEYNPMSAAVFAMLQPILWSFALGWTIFICHTGQAEVLNRILSWKGFVTFSKLSYPFYMVQTLVVFFWMSTIYEPQRISLQFIFNLNEIVTILAVTLLFTQLFLLPLRGIMAAVRRQPKSLKSKKEKDIIVEKPKFEAETFKQKDVLEKRRKNIDVDILKLLADAAPRNESLRF